MEKKELLYEGKAKKVYTTDDPQQLIVSYKDDATAFNGLKKGTITGKGVINNKMSNLLMARLEKEGIVFDQPTFELSYKNDDLGDPLMNDDHALALKLATPEELALIRKYALAVDKLMQEVWAECGVTLVDFKLEFGRLADGAIVLADEISPDTCRLWDSETHEKLDKDRFRRDMGGVEAAYEQVMERLTQHL